MKKQQKGLVMRQVVEIARLYEGGLSKSEIHRSINISRPTVDLYLERFKELALSYESMKNMPWEILQKKLFPSKPSNKKKPQPDWEKILEEMKRPHMTLFLAWSEFKADSPNEECISYSRFCKYYNQYIQSTKVTMRQSHRPGEKIFLDFAGTTMPITDRDTGEITKAQIYVSALGFSNYTFVRAVKSQSLEEFLQANAKSFEYFGGVSEICVPDNLKAAVSKACIYDPVINPQYQEFAIHYGTAIVPARARKPQDKAKVENAVLNISRQILAPLRNQVFHSIGELNIAIKEQLEIFNSRPQQNGLGSRKAIFEAEEKHLLKPLPAKAFEFVNWKKATVGIDYHVQVDGHYYSVPYKYVSQVVEVRYSSTHLSVIKDGVLIAQHLRGLSKSRFSTLEEHMPQAHQEHLNATPEKIKEQAFKIGPNTFSLITQIFNSHKIPETASRRCLGIVKLARKFTAPRLESASKLLLSFDIKNVSYGKMK